MSDEIRIMNKRTENTADTKNMVENTTETENLTEMAPASTNAQETAETAISCSACSTCKKKERTPEEYKSLMNRLSRIEGQVRGVKGMLERDAYCVDILIQVSAINSALNSFNKELLGNHIRSCVVENVRSGNDEVIDELVKTIQRLMK